MIREIHLDMDDVCNTLAMHLLSCVGCNIDPTDYKQHPFTYHKPVSTGNWGYELHEAANVLLGEERYPDSPSFWKTITHEQWVSCPISEIYRWLVHKAARLVGRDNVYITTRPTKSPWCASGKMEWIEHNCPHWLQRQFFITPRKHVLGFPGAVLVDDLETNLQNFSARGGRGILVPRPWNRLWGSDPFEAIEEQFEKIF
jgi:hypothetical protein